MKKSIITAFAVAVLALGAAFVGTVKSSANGDWNHSSYNSTRIVGAWEVDADAPYRPHLFTFHSDGTMSSTNPTNVQESLTALGGGTNDSVGMGAWKVTTEGNDHFVVGTFEELNAVATTHLPTDTLSVSFKVKLSADGKTFDGPASAKLGTSAAVDSHLKGNRVTIDANAVSHL
jgi:hypothetical protein